MTLGLFPASWEKASPSVGRVRLEALYTAGRPFATALLKAEAVAVHLEDVDVMGESVEQDSGEPLGSEDFGPFGEGQVRGQHGRAALVTLAGSLCN